MTLSEPAPAPEPSPYVRSLPVGQPLPIPEAVREWDILPLTGDLSVKPLRPPVLPEPARVGEDSTAGCDSCALSDTDTLWADEHWRVSPLPDSANTGIPGGALLEPRAHLDLGELPMERMVELGPMIQRMERALLSLGGIARVHVNRWGEGSRHFHLWFLARPAGMPQLRGPFLPLWNELLPPLPAAELAAVHRTIAASLAADGGVAYAL
ncbi:hypothetical protein [Streptomyces boninensis]|uniref:hypothetical protein n=1 Tax=Streptomyces boninensis TaxID=2039455 RepID=UPI003B20D250